MPSIDNSAIIASAGSGKTTGIVNAALAMNGKQVLITTYTLENLHNIETCFIRIHGCIPVNIKIQSWFSFLLQDGARPYQNMKGMDIPIESVNFIAVRNRFLKKENLNYYFDKGNNIYRDVFSDYVCETNKASGGKVITRLQDIYDVIYIDEVQDLSGYDLDFVELLLRSEIEVHTVGDPRQSTYFTSRSTRNAKYKGIHIVDWLRELEKKKLLKIDSQAISHRCNQDICDLADDLYPALDRCKSHNTEKTGHDGVHRVQRADIEKYVDEHQPAVLRWDVRVNTGGLPAMNFGTVKGHTFDRVLIFPTGDFRKYLDDGNLSKLKDMTLAKFYVAITRARFSVAFVV
jgi:superfamily I DNA/RNA helicase